MSMKKYKRLAKLMEIVNRAYDEDGTILQAFDGEDCGDGLAKFVVDELRDVTAGERRWIDALHGARLSIERAKYQLEEIVYALEAALDEAETED